MNFPGRALQCASRNLLSNLRMSSAITCVRGSDACALFLFLQWSLTSLEREEGRALDLATWWAAVSASQRLIILQVRCANSYVLWRSPHSRPVLSHSLLLSVRRRPVSCFGLTSQWRARTRAC